MRRKERQVSQGQLAAALGRTFQQVQKYEIGANRISASVLFDAAQFLDTPIGWFFDGLPSDAGDAPVDSDAKTNFWESGEGLVLLEAFPRIDDSYLRSQLIDFVSALAKR